MSVGMMCPTSWILIWCQGSPSTLYLGNWSDIAGITGLQSASFLKILPYFNHTQLNHKRDLKYRLWRYKKATFMTSTMGEELATYTSETRGVAMIEFWSGLVLNGCMVR